MREGQEEEEEKERKGETESREEEGVTASMGKCWTNPLKLVKIGKKKEMFLLLEFL